MNLIFVVANCIIYIDITVSVSSSSIFNRDQYLTVTHKYEMSGIRAYKYGSDGIISFSHHKAVVYPWEFEASFGGWILFQPATD